MLSRFFLIFIPLLTLFSCATITQGTKQNVGISSTPSQASVFIDGNYVGKTPLRISLSRSSSHSVLIELPGYDPYVAEFSRTGNVMSAGNVVFGGPIGLGVDCMSGAIFQLTPDQIHANLQKTGTRVSFTDIENCEDCFVFAVNSGDVSASCLQKFR